MDLELIGVIFNETNLANYVERDEIIPQHVEQMREQMKDPENLLEFLSLFGKAIGIKPVIGDCDADAGYCKQCEKIVGVNRGECIRHNIRKIIENYKPQKAKKWRVVKTVSDERCIKHTCILPGEFSKQQAEDIVKAYNSKEYKIEEVM